MGLLSGSMESLSRSKPRSRSDASNKSGSGHVSDREGDGDEKNSTDLDKEQGNVLMSIISQLRPGMDLSKIALPTFVLEPRSLLERITDFFSHPELIFGVGQEEDPQERFIAVMTYYLSGWHIKPKGVKKPYNPVLGEFFRCSYFYPDGSEGFYIAEQVSHHPPVSAFFYISPKNHVCITGELKPKSKFLGNSAATIMEGEDRIRLLNRPEDGEYRITMPNTYARGIMFGKMILELCDVSRIENEETEFHCDVDFKAKGWISGGYNAISGHVKGPGNREVGEITGHWSDVMEFHEKGAAKYTLFDPKRVKVVPKVVIPESEQEEFESRRLWANLTKAIKAADMHGATAAKTTVEDRQRELAKKREAGGQGNPPSRFFKHVDGDRWMPKLDVERLPQSVEQMEKMVREFIYGDKKAPQSGASVQHASTTSTVPATQAAGTGGQSGSVASAASSMNNLSISAPPAAPTAPGPPAPGPKLDHPI